MILENPSSTFVNFSKLFRSIAVRKRKPCGGQNIGGTWYIPYGPTVKYIISQDIWEVVFFQHEDDKKNLPA